MCGDGGTFDGFACTLGILTENTWRQAESTGNIWTPLYKGFAQFKDIWPSSNPDGYYIGMDEDGVKQGYQSLESSLGASTSDNNSLERSFICTINAKRFCSQQKIMSCFFKKRQTQKTHCSLCHQCSKSRPFYTVNRNQPKITNNI